MRRSLLDRPFLVLPTWEVWHRCLHRHRRRPGWGVRNVVNILELPALSGHTIIPLLGAVQKPDSKLMLWHCMACLRNWSSWAPFWYQECKEFLQWVPLGQYHHLPLPLEWLNSAVSWGVGNILSSNCPPLHPGHWLTPLDFLSYLLIILSQQKLRQQRGWSFYVATPSCYASEDWLEWWVGNKLHPPHCRVSLFWRTTIVWTFTSLSRWWQAHKNNERLRMVWSF